MQLMQCECEKRSPSMKIKKKSFPWVDKTAYKIAVELSLGEATEGPGEKNYKNLGFLWLCRYL